MRTDSNALRLPLLVACLALSLPASAVVPRQEDPLDSRVVPRLLFQRQAQEADITGPGGPESAAFRGRHAGQWRLVFDRRTGALSMASGQGIPFLPGRGNRMTPAEAGLAAAQPTLEEAEKLARAFLEGETTLLLPAIGELRLSKERSGRFDDGRLWYLDFDWYVGGVAVEGARVFLRVNSGNIIQMGTEAIGSGLPDTAPTLTAAQAMRKAFEHAGGRATDDRVIEAGRLVVLPRPATAATFDWGAGVEYRLAWQISFKRGDRHPTWTAEIDAHSGEVLSFFDANRYARVTGGVYARTVVDPEEERPFTRVNVHHGGLIVDTGDDGTFFYDGGPASTTLDGPYFNVLCVGCNAPENAFAFTGQGTGDLRLGTGGANELGNGSSTPAERNSVFHLNRVRAVTSKWLSIPWLDVNLNSFVNINDSCNAFYDGDVNFFRSGSGCNNTGEIADVVYHEWGHGLDGNTLGGDFSTGEGTADIVSMHVTHSAQVGPYFFETGDPVRDVDSSSVGYVLTASNVGTICIDCSALGLNCTDGPLGFEVHCEGEIFGQMHWDLAQAMVSKHGFNTGWQDLERIYFLSMPQTAGFLPSGGNNAYDAYLAADDDNGNLVDGTPNCDEIFAAFDAHAIAGPDCGSSSSGCTRPAEPTASTTPGAGQVTVSWTPVAGATSYAVLRSDFGSGGAYLPVGTTAGTQVIDATVQPGLTYHYVVEAQDAGGCRSTIEGAVTGAAATEARLDLDDVILDDIPAGNRSGFADPSESIDLTTPLRNPLPADGASAAQGVLSSFTPGVTTVVDTVAYGAVPADGTSIGTAYRIALDGTVACGADAALGIDLTDGSGAAARTARLEVLVGERIPRFADDFEANLGWVLGSGTATTGLWDRGDPVGTIWQPDFDSDDPGNQCLFSGQNTSDGDGDIDNGDTVVLSPIIDLSGAVAARLSYKRWWAASIPTDPDNFFIVEVSDDAGGSWTAVEILGSDDRTMGWRPVDVRLELFVALNNQFRIRVSAADGGTGDLVEAAIDDVRVDEVVCDLTPPCFVAPSFAGATGALPGSSCAETDVSWSAATSNCTNATISYNLYRSTTPGFTPGPGSLVVSGLGGTSFHDDLLQPGVDYHYIVRAFDSRSGEDTNLVQESVTAPAGADTVAPQFAGLESVSSGPACGELLLGWSAAAETCSGPVRYEVYRSTTPGFTPGPANLVASTLSSGFTDTALMPAGGFQYVVRAVDTAGNDDGNTLEIGATATILDTLILEETFEASNGGWGTIAPNDATTGLWEWGDPEGTGAQPEDDATPDPGVNAWITGLALAGGLGGNDIDAGTTTLSSADINLTGVVDPVLEMSVFFVNDAGAAPGEDPFQIHVSDDGGASWNPVLVTLASIPDWTVQQFPLSGIITPGSQFRIRVTAEDNLNGSLVEAGTDDVRILEPNTGCLGCPLPVPPVTTIDVTRFGDDVVIDWTDPGGSTAFNIYTLSGVTFADAVRVGSTTTEQFVHEGAALLVGQSFFYRVTTVDDCGQESTLP